MPTMIVYHYQWVISTIKTTINNNVVNIIPSRLLSQNLAMEAKLMIDLALIISPFSLINSKLNHMAGIHFGLQWCLLKHVCVGQ